MMRINPYLLPHKGLRNLLGKVSLNIGNVDLGNALDIRKLKNLSDELFYLLEQHSLVEDIVILPDLEKRKPGSTAENYEEHEFLEKQISVLKELVENLTVRSGPEAFLEYYKKFTKFHADYLMHMLMEENRVLSVIWECYTDEELEIQHHQILASFTPAKILRWFRYIIPALNPEERVQVLSGIKARSPKVFFDTLLAVVEEELCPFDFAVLGMDLLPVPAY